MPKKTKPKTTDTINALSKISRAISSDLYLEDILKLIVTVTAEVMNSRICTLMLLDEKKENLVIRATQSMSEEYIKKQPLKKGEGVAWKAVNENKPVVVPDVLKESGYKYKDIAQKEPLDADQINAWIHVAVNIHNRCVSIGGPAPHHDLRTRLDLG